MTMRLFAPGAAGVLSFLSTAASAATVDSGDLASLTLPAIAVLAGAAILLVAMMLWRRRSKAVSEAVEQARKRAVHRHTERLATQMAEPDF